jgi:polyphosphate kinase
MRTHPRTIDEMEHHPPLGERLPSKSYERELERLQIELLKAQRHVKEVGHRIVVLFEGRDAAGKGGAIKRFTEHLNPRGARTVALAKPTDAERTQWYFQRYVAHLPSAGEIVLFDRSWYNRAGVERVMGFCTDAEYVEFMRQVPAFEQSLVSSGISLFKLWFTVSQDNQRERFEQRRTDPLRQWKLSPIDEAGVELYEHYTAARNDMLRSSSTPVAPWTVVNSNDKRRARLGSIRAVLHHLDYDHKDHDVVGAPDPHVVRPADQLHIDA